MKRWYSENPIKTLGIAQNRPMLLSMLLAGGVAGCIDDDELTDSVLELNEVEPSGPTAVDHLGLSWIVDEPGQQILVIDGNGQTVDRYDLDGLVGGVEDIEVTETHVYVLTIGAEPVIARAGRNDVAPSAWETFSIPSDNLGHRDVTGLLENADGVISLELTFGSEHLPLFTPDGSLDIATAPLALPAASSTHVVVDVSGYIPANSGYVSVDPKPKRHIDTRLNGPNAALPDDYSMEITLAGQAGLPAADQIRAVVLNVTVVDPQGTGWVTVYPEATVPDPLTSNINFAAGETTAGLVLINPGDDGRINLLHFTSSGKSHIIVDVFGYFPPDNDNNNNNDLHMIQPLRVYDSISPLPANQGNPVKVAGVDVDNDGDEDIPLGVGSIIANVTVKNPPGYEWATVYKTGTSMPKTSNLNYYTNSRANLVIIPVSGGGFANIYTTQSARYIVDVLGWFDGETKFQPIKPRRIRDTRFDDPGPLKNIEISIDTVDNTPIPDDALAIFGNLTAVYPTARGYLKVYPDPNNVPDTSNLNFNLGRTVANAILTEVSGGEFYIKATFPSP